MNENNTKTTDISGSTSMRKDISKKILGLFSVLIMLHHLGQKVSAPWLSSTVRQHGLEPFVPIGYLLVSFFFFCSGYGLRKSMQKKEDYLDGFIMRRVNVIFPTVVITGILWILARAKADLMAFPFNPYSWFVVTILVLYLGFFLCYKKEKKISLYLMAAWVLLYSVLCYIPALGNWWINSAPVFLLGIFMADKKAEKSSKKALVIASAVLVVTFFVSEYIGAIWHAIGFSNYGIADIVKILLQITAASAFSLLFYEIALLLGERSSRATAGTPAADTPAADASATNSRPATEESLPGKILSFYGAMTLEFYLIHGLFVEMFNRRFISSSTQPFFYIKNIFLYLIAVLALSTAAAWGIKKAADHAEDAYHRFPLVQRVMHDLKKLVIVLLVVAIGATAFAFFSRRNAASEHKEILEAYEKENITMVDVNGTSIAVYDVGKGKCNIVLLSSYLLPGSTVHLRALADSLSDKNRVVVLDYPGTGFSPDISGDRTNDFFADTIRGTLDALGIKDNIVLVPHLLSSLYAYRFIEKYPQGVIGMAGIDAVVPEIGPHLIDGAYSCEDEYAWNFERSVSVMGLMQKIYAFSGFSSWDLPPFNLIIPSQMQKYIPVMEERFVLDYMQHGHLKENKKAYRNCMALQNYTLPKDLPVMFIESNYVSRDTPYGVNWTDGYHRMITNQSKQTIKTVTHSIYVVYQRPDLLKPLIEELVASTAK